MNCFEQNWCIFWQVSLPSQNGQDISLASSMTRRLNRSCQFFHRWPKSSCFSFFLKSYVSKEPKSCQIFGIFCISIFPRRPIWSLWWRHCMSNNFLMGHTRPLFRLFLVSFKQTIQILQQIIVKKCPFSIWCWDSNSQPLEHETPPITTRPGLHVI